MDLRLWSTLIIEAVDLIWGKKMSKRALVTGGAGYIGSHVVLALLDAGWHVGVVDNLSTGHRNAVPSDVPFLESCLGARDRVSAFITDHGFDSVLHFGAATQVGESVEAPYKYYTNNTVNTLNLIQASIASGVENFVFSSTAAVYGEVGSEPVNEDTPPAPISPYGHSKLMSEQMLRDLADASGLRYLILRYFNVAGADDALRAGQSTPHATHLIKVACEAALGQRKAVTILGEDYDTPDGTGVRDYVHVSDLADAHLAALRYLMAGGSSSTMNCGYGVGYSVRDVLSTLKAVTGRPVPHDVGPRRAGDAASVIARADEIRKVLGWKPSREALEIIVRSAYQWERNRGEI